MAWRSSWPPSTANNWSNDGVESVVEDVVDEEDGDGGGDDDRGLSHS
jgi:hypothetical protein